MTTNESYDRAQASYDARLPRDGPPEVCERCGDEIEPPDDPFEEWLCDDCRFNYRPDSRERTS